MRGGDRLLHMPGAGIEPARPCGLRILSPVCLPISSPRRSLSFKAWAGRDGTGFKSHFAFAKPQTRCDIFSLFNSRPHCAQAQCSSLRPGRELNPRVAVLQTAALPLRHQADHHTVPCGRFVTKYGTNEGRCRGGEMVDARGLGPRGAICGGSSPLPGIKTKEPDAVALGDYCFAAGERTRKILRGIPLSRAGRKIRAEKFLMVTTVKNVLGRVLSPAHTKHPSINARMFCV